MESKEARSQRYGSMFWFPPESRTMSCRVVSPFHSSRVVNATVAPSFASESAVSVPMPEVAPVMKTTLPFMSISIPLNNSMLYAKRRVEG
jgi:hypothetical protein